MPPTDPVWPWPIPYERVRAICLRTAGGLARQGFRAAPAEALDLVHDFLIEEGPATSRNYDAERGTWEAYLSSAFARFARQRLADEARLRESWIDDALAEPVEREAPTTADERTAAAEALGELDEDSLELLESIVEEGVSQRELASRRGQSRFALRRDLAQALGRLAARLERPEHIPEDDWRVVQAVWRDGLTVEEAASLLRTTPGRARAALSGARRYFLRNLPTNRRQRPK